MLYLYGYVLQRIRTMKITKTQLREIIKEELGRLNEYFPGFVDSKIEDLEDDDRKLGRTLANIIGHSADHALIGFIKPGKPSVSFAFIAPTKLGKNELQQLAKLAKEVVIKKDYIYIFT